MYRRYTHEQKAWIAERYADMTSAELAEAYNDRFSVDYATQSTMNDYGSNHGLKKAPGVRARALRKYTDEQLEWLREFIPGHHEDQIIKAFRERFGITLTNPMVGNLKMKLGVKSGTTGGQWRVGHPPANKGKTWDEMGISAEAQARSRATCFKKGTLSGAAREKARPLLDIREEPTSGYLQIKVAPRNKKHPMQNWISLAQFEWMKANGRDWPDGHRVVFADKDNRNFDPDNIVPVPNELYAIVTGGAHGHALPWHDRETLELAILHARVMHKRTRLQMHERECPECGRTFAPEWPRQVRCRPCIDADPHGFKRKKDKICAR